MSPQSVVAVVIRAHMKVPWNLYILLGSFYCN